MNNEAETTKTQDRPNWCDDCHRIHKLFMRAEQKEGYDEAVDIANLLADELDHPHYVGRCS